MTKGLVGLLMLVVLGALGSGAMATSPIQVVAILSELVGFDAFPWVSHEAESAVVLYVRLPRILLGVLVGAAIATGGAALQGLFRNPLADPALIGISAGAALAVVAVTVLGNLLSVALRDTVGGMLLPAAAFFGASATALAVYRLSSVGGRTVISTMLLAGIAINAFAGAATGLCIYMADDDDLRTITFWTLGSLGGASWPTLALCAPFTVVGIAAIQRFGVALNAIALGEIEAVHLGIDVEHVKTCLLLAVAGSVGAAVAVSGIIGFVGLVVPHLIRLLIGPDHRRVLGASAALGAVLLTIADTAARTLVAPAELPLGVLTAFLGAPFLMWLLLQEHPREYL